MRSLQSINAAREEARYISRTWSNQSTPDVAGYYHPKPVVESSDDLILVVRPDPTTISGERCVEMTRRQYEENKEQYQEELRILRGSK